MIDLNSTFLYWIIFGMVLIGSEILTGTAFVLWIGVAACSVGALNWIIPFHFSIACGMFAVLTVVFLWLGKKVIKKTCTDDVSSTLNRRSDAMIGRVLTLSAPITQGTGQIVVGDSVWSVHGPDLPTGTSVTIVSIDGNALVVKPRLS